MKNKLKLSIFMAFAALAGNVTLAAEPTIREQLQKNHVELDAQGKEWYSEFTSKYPDLSQPCMKHFKTLEAEIQEELIKMLPLLVQHELTNRILRCMEKQLDNQTSEAECFCLASSAMLIYIRSNTENKNVAKEVEAVFKKEQQKVAETIFSTKK